ncbi:MAG: hypothetical protein KGL95_02555 [Patescibacteria group bacterium]|nr:hypothetical protein [Patescibacteria group bacterium]
MSSRLKKLQEDLEAVKTDIKRLSGFHDTSFTRKFRRQLEGEKSVILAKISKLTRSKESIEQERLQQLSNVNRLCSAKNKRNWNYVKSIQENYRPDLSAKEIRSLLKKHRKGLETDIPDVAWRNPSP